MLGPGFPPSQGSSGGAAPGKPHITHISSEVHCCRAVVLLMSCCGCVGRWYGMVVRFVCVIRVPVCARVAPVCPVCVPAPHGVFLPVPRSRCFLPDFPTTVVGLLGLDGCVRFVFE